MCPGFIHQGILIDPPNTGRVGAQSRRDPGRQLAGEFLEIFEHATPRPIQIRPVFEDDVHIGDPVFRDPSDPFDSWSILNTMIETQKLIVAISSRVLFALDASNNVYEKEGCEAESLSVFPTLAGGGVLLGGLIDYGTGAVYDLTPNPAHVMLKCTKKDIARREENAKDIIKPTDNK